MEYQCLIAGLIKVFVKLKTKDIDDEGQSCTKAYFELWTTIYLKGYLRWHFLFFRLGLLEVESLDRQHKDQNQSVSDYLANL